MSGEERTSGPPKAYRAARERVRQALQAVRAELALTQEEFGAQALAGASRFVVNRLEVGTSDLKLDQAALIDEFLGVARLAPLVEHRDRLAMAATGEDGRDDLARRLLEIEGIHRLRVVLVDDLDIAALLQDTQYASLIEIVVPSPKRARDLFHDDVIDTYIERQITHLLDLQHLGKPEGIEVRIFESDDVLSSVIHVSFDGGAEVAYWPTVPYDHGASGRLPVVTSADAETCGLMARYVDSLMAKDRRVQPNEAIVFPDRDDTGRVRGAQFARFVPKGVRAPLEPGEGVPVALIMPYAMTVKLRHRVGLRVILYEGHSISDSAGKISLLSGRVQENDIRPVLGLDSDKAVDSRRRRDPMAAAVEVGRALIENDVDYIDEDAYRRCARRDMRESWGLNIDPADFKKVSLPPELMVIEKDEGRIVPQLFTVEIQSTPDQDSGVAPLTRLMEETSRHGTAQYGIDDIVELPHAKLNSFLVNAIEVGFLQKLMADIGIAAR